MADNNSNLDEMSGAPGPASTGNPLVGVLLVMAAVLIFAGMDATTKHLAMHYPVPMVVAVRYFGNLVLLVVFLLPRHGRALVHVQRKGLVLVRALCLASASLFAGLAMKVMPVAETTAIVYFAPIGVMVLAGPLLGEKVGISGWLATLAGFAGVLLIVRPGSGLAPLGVLFALLTAFVSIGYHLLSRLLAGTESTMAMMFYTAVVGTVVFGAMLPWNMHGPMPDLFDLALFASIGAMALVGHYCFTAAYREAPASLLAPVNYVHLMWAGLLGWLIFDHIPDGLSIAGGLLIAASGAGVALWAHRTRSREAQLAKDTADTLAAT